MKNAKRRNTFGTEEFVFTDTEHVPYNKLPNPSNWVWGELSVRRNPVAQWIEVTATEISTDKNGNTRERKIAITLNKEFADQLLKYLSDSTEKTVDNNVQNI